MKKTVSTLVLAFISVALLAQTGGTSKTEVKYGFPQLKNVAIKGSPILGQPMLVQGSTGPVRGEGLGWADPAFFDWNKDGKKDLLIGEFKSNLSFPDSIKFPNLKGSHVRVYLNVGTNEAPRFTDEFEYAKDKTGAYLDVVTSCCVAFATRFYDINNDGYLDIITGSYLGQITCYYGSADGFESPIDIPQVGYPGWENFKLGTKYDDPTGEMYWIYSAADFVDVDGDGLLDLITGGRSLRVSKNIGTKSKPAFGKRTPLLDINGHNLKFSDAPPSNDWNALDIHGAVPLVTDWDQDGVPDLLVTNEYTKEGFPTVLFFKGVKKGKGLSYEPGVPLFEGDTVKLFPGSWLRTWVTDWNNDGIKDLVIGASVPVVGEGMGIMDPMMAWTWEMKLGIIKSNPKHLNIMYPEYADSHVPLIKMLVKRGILEASEEKDYTERLKTMVHQGYVYVMLGTGTHK